MSTRLVIFDKDGTLIDYAMTWDRAVAELLTWATNADRFPDRWRAAADAVDFDLAAGIARPGSPLIAEPNEVVAALLMPWCDPERVPDAATLAQVGMAKGLEYLEPIPGAQPVLEALHDAGIAATIATNDSRASADAMVAALGWDELIDWTVGADSGFGAKPEPGMLLATTERFDVSPAEVIMVGDTAHDMRAARAAGVRGVLLDPTGDASHDAADHVVTALSEVLTYL